MLVDHNSPTPGWRHAPVISIIDHHVDMHTNTSATPRYFATSASCSSLVAQLILDAEDAGQHDHDDMEKSHLPDELLSLLMRAIALDSGGLKPSKTFDVDRESSLRLFRRTSVYRALQKRNPSPMLGKKQEKKELKRLMKLLLAEMAEARGHLDALDLRDLLRRDWKANEYIIALR